MLEAKSSLFVREVVKKKFIIFCPQENAGELYAYIRTHSLLSFYSRENSTRTLEHVLISFYSREKILCVNDGMTKGSEKKKDLKLGFLKYGRW